MEFKNHAEKEFWEKVYLKELEVSGFRDATVHADSAVAARRARMAELVRPGVKAA